MKTSLKITALCLLMAFYSLSCKKEVKHNGYTINGVVKGLDSGWVKLIETGVIGEKNAVLDSTKIVNGSFEFKGKVESPDMINLAIGNKVSRFFLENSAISIEIDSSELKAKNGPFEAKVLGSKTHDEYTRMNEKAQAVFKDPKYSQLDSLGDIFAKARKSGKKEDMDKALELQKSMRALMEERSNAYISLKHNYAKNNPSSPVAVHVLGFQYSEGRMNKDQLKEFYNLFKGDARETGFFKHYITKVYKDVFENLGEGNKAPDFTLNTVNSEPLSLADVKAKYRLIDFWASWCIPCRNSFPHLKELRKKYGKDNFEVVGIGTADVEDKWRTAIKDDQIPWPQVFDISPVTNGRANYGSVAKKYGVPFLPTTFLIDENQTIILRNASHEELDVKLEELIGY